MSRRASARSAARRAPPPARAAAAMALPAALLSGLLLMGAGGCAAGRAPPAPAPGSRAPEAQSPTGAGAASAGGGTATRTAAALQALPDREGGDLLPGEPAPGGDLVVALDGPIDPGNAPSPHNDAERLVFRNLYETLVRAAADGSLRPGLASAWEAADSDRRWVLTLRPGARFWDGSPLRAVDVTASWQRTQRCARGEDMAIPWAWLDVEAASVQAIDERRLVIQLPEPQPDLPALLAAPCLAVAKPGPGLIWPLGSGACIPDEQSGGGILICRPNPHAGGAAPLWRELRFLQLAGRDPLPLLLAAPRGSRTADLAVVRDPATARQAGAAPGLRAVALPWDRVHLLLVPPAAPARPWAQGWERAVQAGADTLAGASAAPASSPFFLAPGAGACPQLRGPAIAGGAVAGGEAGSQNGGGSAGGVAAWRDRVAHRDDDTEAARLAAAIAAWTPRNDPEPPAAAMALDGAAFDEAVRQGLPGAAVLALPRIFASPCLQLASLLCRAGWLQEAGLGAAPAAQDEHPLPATAAARLMAGGVLRPLVATRSHLVARRGLAGLRCDVDGTLRLDGAGWIAP